MHTGDLATIDAEGFGNIVGRIKDMIIRGGENVYAARGRGLPLPPPDVQDVAVFGVAGPALRRGSLRLVRPAPRRSG